MIRFGSMSITLLVGALYGLLITAMLWWIPQNRRGLNGGELVGVRLPNSGVAVDIPLLSTNNVTPQPDESVTPDVVVRRTFAARAGAR